MTLTKEEKIKILIEKEIYQNASTLYHFLLESDASVIVDSWSNTYYSDEQLIDMHGLAGLDEDERRKSIKEFRDSCEDFQDIYEYWMVSKWLYDKLDKANVPVLEFKGVYFWGRTETGLDLKMDSTLNTLVEK